ncbi:hypothetical protein LTR08_005740 [Meristemomyces frigidus]|nr:hypothetical protein LTR08_005740 [Meristemomyces frigidus]
MPTRRLYTDYYAKAVRSNAASTGVAPPMPAVIRRHGVRAWYALTAAQRVQYPIDIGTLATAREERDEEERRTQAPVQAAATWVPTRRFAETVKSNEDAADLFRDLNAVGGTQMKVIAAAQALRVAARAATGNPTATAAHTAIRRFARRERRNERVVQLRFTAEETRLQAIADRPPVPPRPSDGVRKMLEVWLSKARKDGVLTAWRRNFKVSPSVVNPPNSNWQGCWGIGQGGQGSAGLYVSEDAAGLINHRVSKKSALLDVQQWASATKMDGDVRNAVNRLPLEMTCHDAMMKVNGRSTQRPLVPWLVSTVPESGLRTYDLYMEYCPSGDLSSLIEDYSIANW